MHPILARGGMLALYMGVWVLVAGLLGALLADEATLSWWQASLVALPLSLVYAFVCLSAWYVSRGMPLAATAALRVVGTALATAILSSGGWLLIARQWLGALVARGWISRESGVLDVVDTLFFGIGVLLYLLSLAVSYLLGTFEERREVERRALQVQVLSRDAELRSLRAQIDPHFLFNSLQSISALTTVDPPAARRMCLLLADFLRESLAVGAEDRIPLGRELKLVERFLEVERVRFGDRLQSEISNGGADNCVVPPLLLLPLVENAVTHGVAHLLAGGAIRVDVKRRGQRLEIAVENPCDRDRPRGRGGGVGLANVRGRLHAIHGDDAQLRAGEHGGIWRVELTLPATEAHGRT